MLNNSSNHIQKHVISTGDISATLSYFPIPLLCICISLILMFPLTSPCFLHLKDCYTTLLVLCWPDSFPYIPLYSCFTKYP